MGNAGAVFGMAPASGARPPDYHKPEPPEPPKWNREHDVGKYFFNLLLVLQASEPANPRPFQPRGPEPRNPQAFKPQRPRTPELWIPDINPGIRASGIIANYEHNQHNVRSFFFGTKQVPHTLSRMLPRAQRRGQGDEHTVHASAVFS